MYSDPTHVAFIRTNQWMHAIELQSLRVVGPVSDPKTDGWVNYRKVWNQKQRDIDYFVIALNRLRVGVQDINKRLKSNHVTKALDVFNKEVPDIKDLRDIAEHFTDYDWSKGKLESELNNESPTYGWGPEDGHISYRGKRLSISHSLVAARKLHNTVMDELAKAGRKIDLSEWPLVQYKEDVPNLNS